MGGYIVAALCGAVFTLTLRLWAWGNTKRFRALLGMSLVLVACVYIVNTMLIETKLGIYYPSYFTANELSLWIGFVSSGLFAVASEWKEGTRTFQRSWLVVGCYWSTSMLLAPTGWVFILMLSVPFFIWTLVWARLVYDQRLKKDAEEDSRPYQYH